MPTKITATRPRARQSASWPEIAPYALLSLGSFLCGLALVGLLLWKADLLARFGLTGNFYYLVLLPLGLAVAGFLFGAMRSFARYRGHHLGGVLELGGPIVGFALVVIGGFVLPPPAANFPLTVYVHGQAGPQDLILRSQGAVLLDLGSDRRREPIGDKGQAFFPEIPGSFRGQAVNVGLDAEGYELTNSEPKLRLDGTSLYLPVRRKSGHFQGWVKDDQGNPVVGATVTVAGAPTHTNSSGWFALSVPGDRLQPGELVLEVVADGYLPSRDHVTPDSNDSTITLTRRP